MAMTPAEMDRKIDEHFDFEARDDVEGVLATLAPDVVLTWSAGRRGGRMAERRRAPSTRRCSRTSREAR